MVFYKSSYPPSVRTWLKVAPSIALGIYGLLLHPLIMDLNNYRLHERRVKFIWKSSRYERQLRQRDDLYRYAFLPAVNYQPGDETLDHLATSQT